MVGLIENITTAFVLGFLTPLTAVCVLPLYPAFLIYLSNQIAQKENQDKDKNNKFLLPMLASVIVLGVITFMLLLGFIFTFLLNISLTNAIGIISPIAFGILLLISILLIFNVDFSKYIPKPKVSSGGHPLRNAFLYGFFFGAIVVPCNPLFIAALFTRITTLSTFFSGIISFLFFGIGIGVPLFAFSIISTTKTQKIIGFLTKYKRPINMISGLIMFGISVYYLVFVFKVFGF